MSAFIPSLPGGNHLNRTAEDDPAIVQSRTASIHNCSSAASVAGAMVVGTSALMILGVQPLLLGALTDEHRISVVALGQLAMVENLALAACSALGTHFMGGPSIRMKSILGCSALALVDVATYVAYSAGMLFILRASAGVLEGLLLGATVRVLTHTARPERVNGTFLAVGAAPQMLMAYLLPVLIVPRWGSNAGFALLGILSLISLPGAWLLEPVGASDARAPGRPPVTAGALIGLLGVVIQNAAIGGAWNYFEQLGSQQGVSADTIGLAVSGSLGFQIAGALFVAWVGWRAPARLVLLIGILLQAFVVFEVAQLTSRSNLYTAAAWGFGLLWLSLQPYQLRALIRLDPSRRIALLMMPCALVGLSLGPLAVSWFIEADRVGIVFRVAAVLFSVAALCFEATHWLVREAASPT